MLDIWAQATMLSKQGLYPLNYLHSPASIFFFFFKWKPSVRSVSRNSFLIKSKNSSSYRTLSLKINVSQEQHKSTSHQTGPLLFTNTYPPTRDLVIRCSSPTGTYRHPGHLKQCRGWWRGGAEDHHTHPHQALNFMSFPLRAKWTQVSGTKGNGKTGHLNTSASNLQKM